MNLLILYLMTFILPSLPYAPDSLQPAISEQTVAFHSGKHHQTYVNNLNTLLKESPFENVDLETIVKKSKGALFNNASQVWNHTFYFDQFSPKGNRQPTGRLAKAIQAKWGSFEVFQTEITNTGLSLFGSGWVWLTADKIGELFIVKEMNAGNPLTNGLKPIMTFDVWEHAYYLDYQNRRADYLKALWSILDWDVISARY